METWLVQLITATLGAFAFSLIFNVRGKMVLFTTLGGLVAWGGYLLLKRLGFSPVTGYFFVSIFITIYAEINARIQKAPATVFLVCAIIPLVPGSRLYATMVHAVHQNWSGFMEKGLETLMLAMALAGGIIFISTIMHAMHAYREIRKQRKR